METEIIVQTAVAKWEISYNEAMKIECEIDKRIKNTQRDLYWLKRAASLS